jgi:hypothetical protein
LDDADVFWNADPDGFVAAELNGEMIAEARSCSPRGKVIRRQIRGNY